MRKACKNCSKWEKHFYWSHVDHTKILFWKRMDSFFMKKMDLPNDFCKNFKGQIGKTVELKGPSGNVWKVRVIKLAKKITFQSGWKDFVIANNIEENDFLIFKYCANSSFQVQIFDQGGCERVFTCFVGIEETKVRESSDSSVQVLEGPDRKLLQDKITIYGSSSDSEYSSDRTSAKMSGGGRASREGISKENCRGTFKARTNVQITFRRGLFLSPSQKKRALQLSEGIQPENPCFAIMMAGTSTYNIPAKFAHKHLPRLAKMAILQYKGQSYSMPIHYNGSKPYFSAEWRQFVKDNGLEEGDLCMFELAVKNKDTISFKVHISRK